jgi:hypothetical protein
LTSTFFDESINFGICDFTLTLCHGFASYKRKQGYPKAAPFGVMMLNLDVSSVDSRRASSSMAKFVSLILYFLLTTAFCRMIKKYGTNFVDFIGFVVAFETGEK